MDSTKHDRLMAEYHAYTCKMIAEFEESGKQVEILGFGKWMEQREQPKRPNEFDNGR